MIRREFLMALGSAAIGTGTFRAKATLAMGTSELITLSDGHLVLPRRFALGDLPVEEALAELARFDLDPDSLTPDCNATLLRTDERTVLFDAGAGTEFMASAGRLPDSLADIGVDPFDITDVVLTHAHPDHIWGVLDDFGDLMAPDATYHIGAAEMDHWTNPDLIERISPDRQSFVVGAARRIAEMEAQLNRFGDGQEIVPGVMARATPGHTPGHMSFEVSASGQEVMILGDCVGNHHLAMARPEWPAAADEDPETGIATRVALLDELASREVLCVGFHMPAPGLGRVERRAAGAYAFIAEDG